LFAASSSSSSSSSSSEGKVQVVVDDTVQRFGAPSFTVLNWGKPEIIGRSKKLVTIGFRAVRNLEFQTTETIYSCDGGHGRHLESKPTCGCVNITSEPKLSRPFSRDVVLTIRKDAVSGKARYRVGFLIRPGATGYGL
jgi:hypothetical protein